MGSGSTPSCLQAPSSRPVRGLPGGVPGEVVTVGWPELSLDGLMVSRGPVTPAVALPPLVQTAPPQHPPSPPSLPPQVICCEGNAGFYEVGCVSTPLEGRPLVHVPPLHRGGFLMLARLPRPTGSQPPPPLCYSWLLRPGLESSRLCWKHGETLSRTLSFPRVLRVFLCSAMGGRKLLPVSAGPSTCDLGAGDTDRQRAQWVTVSLLQGGCEKGPH